MGKIEERFYQMKRFWVFIVVFISLALHAIYAADVMAQKTSPAQKKTPRRLQGRVNQLLELLTAAGIQLEGDAVPGKVAKVNLGTSASYNGIRAGDDLKRAILDGSILILDLQRGDKQFQTRLATDKLAQKRLAPRVVPIDTSTYTGGLTDGLSDAAVDELLRGYDLAIVVDKSGSMKYKFPDSDLDSKWSWCARTVQGLSEHVGDSFGGKLHLVVFNAEAKVWRDCSLNDVEDVFSSYRPGGLTNISGAIESAAQLKTKRPLLIAVITDGEPTYGGSVVDTLIDLSQRAGSRGDYVVTFLQIGLGGDTALNFFKVLDEDLVSRGAKFDIVDWKIFAELKRLGLARVLAEAIADAKRNSPKQP